MTGRVDETSEDLPLPEPQPARSRFSRWLLGSILIFLFACAIGTVLYLNSDSFHQRVRLKIISELELMTGGRAEIQSINWKLLRLQFELRGLTIHGNEAPTDVPYLHADRVFVHAHILSLFSRTIGLQEITIDRPVVHLIVTPAGVINQPSPRNKLEPGNLASVQRLFDVVASQLNINDGALLINERQFPFAFQGRKLSAGLTYLPRENAYEGHLAISTVDARFQQQHAAGGDLDARFRLYPTHMEIQAATLKLEASTLQASGSLTDYSSPKIHLQYTALLDLRQVGRSAGLAALQGGRLDAKGILDYGQGAYSTSGDMTVREMRWHDSGIRLDDVAGTSHYSIVPQKISLSRLTAHLLGGEAQGEVAVANWNPAVMPGKKVLPQQGSAVLRLSGMQIAAFAAAVSTPRLPLNRMKLAGAVGGLTNTIWTGSPANAVTSLSLNVAPPANISPDQVPVTARVQGKWHAAPQTLDLTALNLATRAIRLNMTGTLGSSATQAQFAFNATDLQELQPVLAALSPGTEIPVSVTGHAAFNGAISGKLRQPSVRGRLEMRDFAMLLQPSGAALGTAPHAVHWDSLVTDVRYTPDSLSLQNGVLRRGAMQTALSGTVALHEGRFIRQNSQIALNLQLQGGTVEELLQLAQLNYPVTGFVNGTLQARGTLDDLRGGGHVEVTAITAYSEPFRSLTADYTLTGPQIQLTNLVLSHNGARVGGSAGWNRDTRAVNYDLRGSNIALADFRRFAPPRFTIDGTGDFHAFGSGTLDQPIINADLHVHHLVLNGVLEGDLNALAETRGEDLSVQGSSVLHGANFNLNGTVHMRGDFPVQARLTFANFNFDPLMHAYMRADIAGHSSTAGTIDIQGPLRNPRELTITGNLSELSADVETVHLHNDTPVTFSMKDQVLRVLQAHLVGENTDLNLRGSVQFNTDHNLSLRSDGRVNLKLLQTLDPELVSYGLATFTFRVSGPFSGPQMSGRLNISDGGASFVDLPNGLSKINGTLVFQQDRLQIEKLTALTGGGELNLGGYITYRNGLYFDLTANGKDVRLRYPPGVSASADAALRFTGSARNSLLSGDITINRFTINERFDFARYLAKTKTQQPVTLNPFLDNLRLDIHVVTTPELRVETSMAKVTGDADLHIRGTASRPVVLGRINIADGDVYFNGTKYHLERGDILFSNPLQIDPVLSIEMSARVRDYDITMGFNGSVQRGLTTTYRSDPPLPSSDILALLAFGRTREEELYTASQPGQAAADTDTNAVLGQALNSALTSRVQRLFGGSRVKIDPQFIGSENNPTARVTIEQQITNDLTFTYITSVTQSSQTIIQMEYNVNKSISIVAVRDQNGVVGFDVRIRQRKR